MNYGYPAMTGFDPTSVGRDKTGTNGLVVVKIMKHENNGVASTEV